MTSSDIRHLARELKALLARIETVPDTLSSHQSKTLRMELEGVALELRERLAWLDPVKQPDAMFDPADPGLFGIFAAVALLGQNRIQLDDLATNRFYGSGIYAIYYAGSYPLYQPIIRTENPIYVGVASSAIAVARTPREQGTKLADRLREHRKNIMKANNLSIDDFTCRHLVVTTGWEGKAEQALIHLFHPIWNKETRLIQGFGKHGDAMQTRGNKRSPWDVLHEGRKWAQGSDEGDVENQKSHRQITDQLSAHFTAHPPIQGIQQVLHDLLTQIKKP